MSEWKTYKLGDVCSRLRSGKNISTKEVLNIGSYPVYGGNGLRGYSESSNFIGDCVIIGRQGAYCGNVRYFSGEGYMTEHAIVAVANEYSNTRFLAYMLSTMHLENLSAQSAQPGISVRTLSAQPILLPPLKIQEQITDILSSLDDKIDLLQRENETLEALAETLFRVCFIEKESDEWKEGKLIDEFTLIMGQSPLGSTYNEEGIGTPLYQGNADFGFRFPTNRVFTTDPKRFAEKYDTLISVRAPVGAQNMATEKCCIGRGVAAIRYTKDNSFYSYTYYKLKSLMNDIQQYNDNGTVFGSITKSDFESLDVILPDFQTICDFQNQVQSIDEKIYLNYQEIQTLTNTRDILISKLFSNN